MCVCIVVHTPGLLGPDIMLNIFAYCAYAHSGCTGYFYTWIEVRVRALVLLICLFVRTMFCIVLSLQAISFAHTLPAHDLHFFRVYVHEYLRPSCAQRMCVHLAAHNHLLFSFLKVLQISCLFLHFPLTWHLGGASTMPHILNWFSPLSTLA